MLELGLSGKTIYICRNGLVQLIMDFGCRIFVETNLVGYMEENVN